MMFSPTASHDTLNKPNSAFNYFQQNTDNKIYLIGDVTDWVVLPNDIDYYLNLPDNSVYNEPYVQIKKDVIDTVDHYIDFREYDSDNNGEVDGIIFLAPYHDASDTDNTFNGNGVFNSISKGVVTPRIAGRGDSACGFYYIDAGGDTLYYTNDENFPMYCHIYISLDFHKDSPGIFHFGTLLHEFTHIAPIKWYGLKYLNSKGSSPRDYSIYDLYNSGEVIESYGLMSKGGHIHVKDCEYKEVYINGEPIGSYDTCNAPAHFSAYTKMKLDFVETHVVEYGTSETIILYQTEENTYAGDTKVIKVETDAKDSNKYYLLEWRVGDQFETGHTFDIGLKEPLGIDPFTLPSDGALLIYDVEETEPNWLGVESANQIELQTTYLKEIGDNYENEHIKFKIVDISADRSYVEVMIEYLNIPDLMIESSDLVFSDNPAKEGWTVVMTATIHNNGGGRVLQDNVKVEIYDTFYDPYTKTLLDTQLIGPLEAGESTVVKYRWTASGVGKHDISVLLDTEDIVTEIEEKNNGIIKGLTVTAITNTPPVSVPKSDIVRVCSGTYICNWPGTRKEVCEKAPGCVWVGEPYGEFCTQATGFVGDCTDISDEDTCKGLYGCTWAQGDVPVGELITFDGSESYDPDGKIEKMKIHQPGPIEGEDVIIQDFGGYENKNRGDAVLIGAGSAYGGIVRSLIRFNLINMLPGDVEVVWSDLDLSLGSSVFKQGEVTDYSIHKVISPWEELTVTWNNWNNGGVAGTDFAENPTDVIHITWPSSVTFDISEDVKDAIASGNVVDELIKEVGEGEGNIFTTYWHSSDSSIGWPELKIMYRTYDLVYDWDFGGGTTGTGETISHTYLNPGTYTVTLTVTDTEGNSDIETLTITVT
jgi:hypothetical protein